jgi:hypothetical protein
VQAEARFAMECNLRGLFKNTLGVDEMPDYNIYYVLGHYHAWGNYFNLNFVNADGSQRSIVEFDSQPGGDLEMCAMFAYIDADLAFRAYQATAYWCRWARMKKAVRCTTCRPAPDCSASASKTSGTGQADAYAT